MTPDMLRGTARPDRSATVVRSRQLRLVVIVVLLVIAAPRPASAQTVLVPERTIARVLHASPDAPPLDVYVDDELLVSAASYGTVSEYLPIPTGEHELQVVPAGGDPLRQALVTIELEFDRETFQLLAVQNYLNGMTLSAYPQDLSQIDGQGYARIRLIHLVPDANGLTMALPDGDDLFDSVVPLTASRYKDIQAGSQTVTIRPERQMVAQIEQPLALLPNADYDIVVIGQIRDNSIRVMPLVAATAQPCGQFLGIGGTESGCLRVVNASPDIPSVDVYTGDATQPAASGLAFGVASPVISLPSGDVEVRIVPSGGDPAGSLASTSLFVEGGNGFLLLSSGTADRAILESYDDSNQPLAGNLARVSVVHQTNHGGMLDISANGEPLVRAILEGEESGSRVVPAGTYVFEATTNPDATRVVLGQEVALEAGQHYQIIVAGDTEKDVVTVVIAGIPVPTDITIPPP